MFPSDFFKICSGLKKVFSDAPKVTDCSVSATMVSYVPFSGDGVALNVAKAIPFEPINVSFRTYDSDFVKKLSAFPVQTFRGDVSNLISQLSNL